MILADWHEFASTQGALPPERRCVLVQIAPNPGGGGSGVGFTEGYPASVAVGYLKFAAGDEDCPYFVVPGFPGPYFLVTHWADVFKGEFVCPLWPGTHNGSLR